MKKFYASASAKADARKLCDCPRSEPGKIKIDSGEHLLKCRFRKRSIRYATKFSVVPNEIRDGCSLGVALGEESL
jgi:hypothetical protein